MAFVFENPHENKNFASENELPYIIALIRSEKIGPVSFYDAIAKYSSPKNAYTALLEKAKTSTRKVCSLDDANKEIEQNLKNKSAIISVFSKEYPSILANINDAPPIISCKGNSQSLNDVNGIAIVGARNASALARKLAESFASELAGNNLCVISGLARGIDFAAHSGALKTKNTLPTIGVIAGGIDNIYPKENAKLYEEIAEKGVIISENAFGALPKTESFPRRNRIISGLSSITVLVEAAIKSGSLITARFAAEQGREVACVPGFPLDPRSGGTNMLIKNGASLVETAEDIMAIYNSIAGSLIPREPKPRVNNTQHTMELAAVEESYQVVQANDDAILGNLSTTPITVDDLVKLTGANIAELNSALIEYELEGKITRHAGGKYSKVV